MSTKHVADGGRGRSHLGGRIHDVVYSRAAARVGGCRIGTCLQQPLHPPEISRSSSAHQSRCPESALNVKIKRDRKQQGTYLSLSLAEGLLVATVLRRYLSPQSYFCCTENGWQQTHWSTNSNISEPSQAAARRNAGGLSGAFRQRASVPG